MVAEDLFEELDGIVQDFLARCEREPALIKSEEGPGWGMREVLAHFIYWHQVGAWSIASVNAGGPPWRSPGSADEMNAAVVPLHGEESAQELVSQLRLAHARLARAVREARDPNAVVGVRGNGEPMTLAQRLQLSAGHWRGHLAELGS